MSAVTMMKQLHLSTTAEDNKSSSDGDLLYTLLFTHNQSMVERAITDLYAKLTTEPHPNLSDHDRRTLSVWSQSHTDRDFSALFIMVGLIQVESFCATILSQSPSAKVMSFIDHLHSEFDIALNNAPDSPYPTFRHFVWAMRAYYRSR